MRLRVEQVAFSYPSGVQALRGVSLAVESGEALAIVGENGAGKTTLARHLIGLLKPDSGRVQVGDWDTAGRSPSQLAQRVGFAFQNPDDQLFSQTVWEEVAFGPRNLGLRRQALPARVERALQRVGLEEHAGQHPYDLPWDRRKLLGIASILAMETPIVVLDEPTTGQDAAGADRLGQILRGLKDEGRTLVTISHDLDFCAEHFERTVVMVAGQVAADGPSEEVLCRADLLAQAAVEPPQLVRLALALGMESAPLKLGAFLEAWEQKPRRRRQERGGEPFTPGGDPEQLR